MPFLPSSLLPAFEACRKVHRTYGKSYYFATRFFPYEKRLATHALYAFFRIPDEIVDTREGLSDGEMKERLMAWKEKWFEAYTTQKPTNPILDAAAWVFHAYSVPFEYSEAFFGAMVQDTEKSTYATYAELERYMYGSAAAVGLMMSHVIGFSDPRALVYARKLGEAMQLTNFLRDVREDWDERRRIYLPLEDLARFGVSPQDIASRVKTPSFEALMRFEIGRADALYEEANLGIPLLHADGRFAVRAASDLYRQILRKIEGQVYDVFRGRVRTSLFEKILIASHAYRQTFI